MSLGCLSLKNGFQRPAYLSLKLRNSFVYFENHLKILKNIFLLISFSKVFLENVQILSCTFIFEVIPKKSKTIFKLFHLQNSKIKKYFFQIHLQELHK